MKLNKWLPVVLLAAGVLFGSTLAAAAEVTIRNVSYDPTREFYVDFNAAFAKYWKAKAGRMWWSTSRTAAQVDRRVRSSMGCRRML
jgi:ABC-type sulfate transport system substrate-binding protein